MTSIKYNLRFAQAQFTMWNNIHRYATPDETFKTFRQKLDCRFTPAELEAITLEKVLTTIYPISYGKWLLKAYKQQPMTAAQSRLLHDHYQLKRLRALNHARNLVGSSVYDTSDYL